MTTRRSVTGFLLLATLVYVFAVLVMGHPYLTALEVYGGGVVGWSLARYRKRART